MTTQKLIPENEVTGRLNRAKQVVGIVKSKYDAALEAKKEAQLLVHFLNTDNNSKNAQINDLVDEWVDLKTNYDLANGIAGAAVDENAKLANQNAKLEADQKGLVDLVQKRTGQLIKAEVEKLGFQTMAAVAVDANGVLEGTVIDLQADIYDAHQTHKVDTADIAKLEVGYANLENQNDALQNQVIDGVLAEGKQAVRLNNQRSTIRNIYSRESEREEKLQETKRDVRRLEITADELSDQARVQTARANKFKDKSKRAGRIVAEQLAEVSEANIAYVGAKQEAQDAKTSLDDAKEQLVNLELDNLVLKQKNIGFQDRVNVLDAGVDVAIEANIEFQSELYGAKLGIDAQKARTKKVIGIAKVLKARVADLETDVLAVELEKTAVTQKYEDSKADIAKLERGYAQLEDNYAGLEQDNAGLGEIIDALSDANSDLNATADFAIEASVGLQEKLAKSDANAVAQEVRAQNAEARNERYNDANIASCKKVEELDKISDELLSVNLVLQEKLAEAYAIAVVQEVRAQDAEARNSRYNDAVIHSCDKVEKLAAEKEGLIERSTDLKKRLVEAEARNEMYNAAVIQACGKVDELTVQKTAVEKAAADLGSRLSDAEAMLPKPVPTVSFDEVRNAYRTFTVGSSVEIDMCANETANAVRGKNVGTNIVVDMIKILAPSRETADKSTGKYPALSVSTAVYSILKAVKPNVDFEAVRSKLVGIKDAGLPIRFVPDYVAKKMLN